jgi:hypothetical protein
MQHGESFLWVGIAIFNAVLLMRVGAFLFLFFSFFGALKYDVFRVRRISIHGQW